MKEIHEVPILMRVGARPIDMMMTVRVWLPPGELIRPRGVGGDRKRIRLGRKRDLSHRVGQDPLKRWTVYEFTGRIIRHELVRSEEPVPGVWGKGLYNEVEFSVLSDVHRYRAWLKPGGALDRCYRWARGLRPWSDNFTPY